MLERIQTRPQALIQYDPGLKDVDGLTAKQRAFCDHYIELNSTTQPVARRGFGTEACRRAGYQGSDEALGVQAWQNLRSAKIREYIRKQLSLVAMPAGEVLKRLSKQARADLAQVLQPDGSFDFTEAKRRGNTDLIRKLKTRTITRSLKDGESETEVIHELELHNAQSALELLAKHHNLLNEHQSDTTVNIGTLNIDQRKVQLAELLLQLAPSERPAQLSE